MSSINKEEGTITIENYELNTKVLEDGTEVVQLGSSLAFNEGFIAKCKEIGVVEWVKKEE